jgi:hypothetical protein
MWADYEGQDICLKCYLAVKLNTKPNRHDDTLLNFVVLQAAMQDLHCCQGSLQTAAL